MKKKWKIEDYNLLAMSEKQPIFNVVSTSKRKIEKVPRGIRGEKSSKDMASSRNLVSTIEALASPKIDSFLLNKIECLFNVEVRRCFNLYLPAGLRRITGNSPNLKPV